MAQRRMFSKKITETDTFLDMPMSSQCLYFHLNMSADDDGFIGNAKTIKRMVGAGDDDLKLLLNKEFLIPFDSGVVVIKDWKIHNYIRKDTYNETHYQHEKRQIAQKENGSYTVRGRDVDGSSTQVRLGKEREGKDRLAEGREELPAAARDHLESVFSSLNPNMSEDLIFYNDKFDEPNEVIIEAVDISVMRGKRNWNYAKSIIQGWRNEGLKTLDEVRKHENKGKLQQYKQNDYQPTPEQQKQIDQLGF